MTVLATAGACHVLSHVSFDRLSPMLLGPSIFKKSVYLYMLIVPGV